MSGISLTHVMVGSNDLEASKRFYDATFGALGISPGIFDPNGRIFYQLSSGAFFVTKPIDGKAATFANGGTLGFAAESSKQIDEWHKAGIAAGGTTCEDPPGARPLPNPVGDATHAYAAYLRDPTGNKLCVSCLV